VFPDTKPLRALAGGRPKIGYPFRAVDAAWMRPLDSGKDENMPPHASLPLFLILSVADLLLTWFLVGSGNGPVYEANPAAAWALSRFGWAGLAAVKVASVLVFT